ADVLDAPFAGGLLRVLMSRGANDPITRQLNSAFWEERFAVSGQLVERAVQRRELPAGTDSRLLLEFAASPLYFRALVVGARISDADIDEIVLRVIRAFSAG
ncbi:MAG TPA: TetR-like C-terminal domain-containing protein, partial [Fluviicoccus sp.]|nr:TetR-like C-terminal domain-containing protein [Fluviicoccus sp.]